jgi:hypothetical protein
MPFARRNRNQSIINEKEENLDHGSKGSPRKVPKMENYSIWGYENVQQISSGLVKRFSSCTHLNILLKTKWPPMAAILDFREI